jgi:hypothetical protein
MPTNPTTFSCSAIDGIPQRRNSARRIGFVTSPSRAESSPFKLAADFP